MIKQLNNTNDFIDFKDIFSLKIHANLLAYYEFDNISKFWVSDGCIYNLWADNLTISGEVDIDFVDFVKPKTIMCSTINALSLSLIPLIEGEVMYKQKSGLKCNLPFLYENNFEDIYLILNSSKMLHSYDDFLLDMSHKLRRGLASYSLVDNKAVALSSYIDDSGAIITAVGVLPQFRNSGFGTKALKSLEQKLQGRDLYLFKEKNKNDKFYKNNNYTVIDNWILGER